MKRAVAQVIGAAFFQLYKRAHHFYNVEPGKNLLYGVLRDHEAPNILLESFEMDLSIVFKSYRCFQREKQ